MAEPPQPVIDRRSTARSAKAFRAASAAYRVTPGSHLILSGASRCWAPRRIVADRGGILQVGDMLAAPAVLLNARYLMSARVAQDSRILFIPASQVRR
jgi:CRP-like cAMP-binding protein